MEKSIMPVMIEHILKQSSRSSSATETPQLWEQDYQKAMTVLNEIFEVYERHEVTPIEGYTIAAALADTIYAVLSDTAQTD